jgi:hypothetical protein
MNNDDETDGPAMGIAYSEFGNYNFNPCGVNIIDKTSDPLTVFKSYVFSVSNDLKSIFNISASDQKEMCDMASIVEHVNYKNPAAYILGYLTISNGKIDNKLFKQIQSKLGSSLFTDKYFISDVDVVRYARLWENLIIKSF